MWLVASRRPIALGLNTQLQRPSNRGKEAAGWVQARSSGRFVPSCLVLCWVFTSSLPGASRMASFSPRTTYSPMGMVPFSKTLVEESQNCEGKNLSFFNRWIPQHPLKDKVPGRMQRWRKPGPCLPGVHYLVRETSAQLTRSDPRGAGCSGDTWEHEEQPQRLKRLGEDFWEM